jgi:bifunctional DNA-binding transcriptional regulator/antitoxin component of YhaV-PrlF toxin-antitoxin module
MAKMGIVRRFDDLGRICIPREIRETIFGKRDITGEPVEIFSDGKTIILQCLAESALEKAIKKIPDLAEKWNATSRSKVPYEFAHWLAEQLKEEQ